MTRSRKTTDKSHRKSETILVRRAPGKATQAILQYGPLRLRAALGRSGITSVKREGDGATPRAAMRLIAGYRRGDRMGALKTALPVQRIGKDMLWCDAPGHPAYNRPVRAPFVASHEKLTRNDRSYDVCIVMDWNVTSRRRGCGSAIFFHIAREGYAPTEGCVALSPADMRRLLPFLDTRTVLTVL
ncbi:MAG: L,D-transpeptidase family protein [Arenimonas sp.]|nr:L,D-transpeptidase family protein [Rhizobium sp.]MBW8446564.1 L,D-transpeptidase family protein [Arenimonas sp.]